MTQTQYIHIKGTQTDEFLSGEHEGDLCSIILNAAAGNPKTSHQLHSCEAADGVTYTTRSCTSYCEVTAELLEALNFRGAFRRCGRLSAALAGGIALIEAVFMEWEQ